MSSVKLAVLAIGLFGLQLSACSHAEPAPKDFVLVNPRAAETAVPEPEAPSGPGAWSRIGKENRVQNKGDKAKEARAETVPTLESAEAACKAETERKGIASMVAIFSRLRKGSADADYIACMNRHGYEVKQ